MANVPIFGKRLRVFIPARKTISAQKRKRILTFPLLSGGKTKFRLFLPAGYGNRALKDKIGNICQYRRKIYFAPDGKIKNGITERHAV